MILCYVWTAAICVTALFGDTLLQILSRDELKSVADSSTHGLIGSFSWAATLSYIRSRRYSITGSQIVDVALCGFVASAIDLDHFYAAHSFSLKAAISLDKRPPLHCTSYWIIPLSLAFLVAVVLKLEWLNILAWLTVVAVLSHHIRDATRRGMWFWPVGSTPPIPYWGYISLLAALPFVVSFLVSRSSASHSANTINIV